MVAQMCRGCWCRLATTFAAHINGTQIAIWASTGCFGTVTKAQASLCKYADSPEPSLPANEILVLITLSSPVTIWLMLACERREILLIKIQNKIPQ